MPNTCKFQFLNIKYNVATKKYYETDKLNIDFLNQLSLNLQNCLKNKINFIEILFQNSNILRSSNWQIVLNVKMFERIFISAYFSHLAILTSHYFIGSVFQTELFITMLFFKQIIFDITGLNNPIRALICFKKWKTVKDEIAMG